MSSSPAHSDLPSPTEMGADGRRVREALGLPEPWSRAARAAVPSPDLALEDPRDDRSRRGVTVPRSASRLAADVYGDD